MTADVKTLAGALADAAGSSSGFTYIADDGSERQQPYECLHDRALAVAGSLKRAGLARGDVVVLILPDAEQFLTAFFGVAAAGLVPAPLYPPAHAGSFNAFLATTGPIVRGSAAAAIVTTPMLRVLLGTVQAGAPSLGAVLAYDDLAGPALPAPEPARPEDPALLQLTSGSTSDPKGVVLTHANLSANIDAIGGPHGLAFSERDIGVSWLPLYHDMGLIGMALAALYFRRSSVLLSPQSFLKRPVGWLRAISRHRGTVSFAPNFAYDLCVRRVKATEVADLDLSSWRIAGCGAEPIQAATLEAFGRMFAPAGFDERSLLPCYGLAEHTLAVAFPPPGRGLRIDTVAALGLSEDRAAVPAGDHAAATTRLVSCGHPFPGHAIRIVDERDRPVGERQVGEIALSGPSVMSGYLGKPALTTATLRGGWLHTGDQGYLAGGELYLCGREKETIIVHGRNYYPQDLEWAVSDLPGVRRGRVAAFATDGFREPAKVVMVLETGRAQPDALAASVRARILEVMGVVVDEVIFAPSGTIPRTTSGKLQRARLRARYEKDGLAGVPRARTVLLRELAASQWGYVRVMMNRAIRQLKP